MIGWPNKVRRHAHRNKPFLLMEGCLSFPLKTRIEINQKRSPRTYRPKKQFQVSILLLLGKKTKSTLLDSLNTGRYRLSVESIEPSLHVYILFWQQTGPRRDCGKASTSSRKPGREETGENRPRSNVVDQPYHDLDHHQSSSNVAIYPKSVLSVIYCARQITCLNSLTIRTS